MDQPATTTEDLQASFGPMFEKQLRRRFMGQPLYRNEDYQRLIWVVSTLSELIASPSNQCPSATFLPACGLRLGHSSTCGHVLDILTQTRTALRNTKR